MIFEVKSANVCIILVFFYGVSSYPRPSDSNAEIVVSDSDSKILNELTNSNKKEVLIKYLSGMKKDMLENMPHQDHHQQLAEKSKDSSGMQQKEGALTGSIEIDDENIKEHVEIPSNYEILNKYYTISKHSSDMQQEEGALTGSIEIDDENIEGHVEIPSDYKNLNENYQIGKHSNDMQQKEGALTGSIEINDENIKGHIELPSDYENLNENYPIGKNSSSMHQNKNALTGSIEICDKNIKGLIELPSDYENPNKNYLNGKHNSDMQQMEGAITGSIEIDDENIKGHIELPNDYENLNENYPIGKHSSDMQQKEAAITGSIEIDDENIKGHIGLPSDYENQNENYPIGKHSSCLQQNKDVLTGSTEIDDKNIKGHIELPSDYENQNENYPNGKHNSDMPQKEGALTGSIEIDDENIKGHLELPSDYENLNENYPIGNNNSDMQQKEGTLTGSIDIDDENIKGYVELPSDEFDLHEAISQNEEHRPSKYLPKSGKNCWMSLKAKHYLHALDMIDAKYAKARQDYQAQVGKEFDKKMMAVMLESQGAAPRAVHQAQGDPSRIPAGINLGGFCMMRMPGSILFFHRMKLRNSTRFSVKYLHTDLKNMALTVRMSLNDLHLLGAYERATTDRNPGILYYIPNFGEVEMLLKKVFYKMEGRLRMLNNRLIVELVNSNLLTTDILMKYANDSTSLKLKPRNIEDFLERLKADLDLWLKDYFNDYLMYFGIVGGSNSEIQTYEKEKTIELNAYADYAVKGIKERLRSLGASSVKIPNFTITSVLNTQIKLRDGVLRGLDSMYRRSVATTKKENDIRQLDIIIGFSNLKLEFKYEALVGQGMPSLSGKLFLTADELTAHMELAQIAEPETIDLNFDSIVQTKPDSLTIEGPANRMIANFKQLLEHPIIAIMTNTMKHNIKMMKTLTRCVPHIYGAGNQILPSDAISKEANSASHVYPTNDDHNNNFIDLTVLQHNDDELPYEHYQ